MLQNPDSGNRGTTAPRNPRMYVVSLIMSTTMQPHQVVSWSNPHKDKVERFKKIQPWEINFGAEFRISVFV